MTAYHWGIVAMLLFIGVVMFREMIQEGQWPQQ